MTRTQNTPNCCYCNKPLTENDTDAETGGFWSAHFETCVHENNAGKYQVISAHTVQTWTYTTRKRAEAQAEHLGRFNPGTRFLVVTLAVGVRHD